MGLYLPPFDNVTIYFLKELMGGQKKTIRTTLIRTVHVPQYDGLGVKEIRQFLDEHHPEVYAYLPEPSIELPKVPKAWLANVCATLLHEKFTKWVKEQVAARHEKVLELKDMGIVMDPEMAKIFNASTAVSSK